MTRLLIKILCFFGLYFFLFPFPLFTQEANLGEIKVEGKVEKLKQPTSFSSVIKIQDHEKQNQSTADFLSKQPSLQIQQFGGLGQYSSVSIRGSSSEQVSVYLDDIKLNGAQNSSFDFSSIPLSQIERIEIRRGAASAELGSEALGGAIYLYTKQKIKKKQFQFLIGASSYNTYKTQLSLSAQKDKLAIYLSHSHQQSDGNFQFKPSQLSISGLPVGSNGLVYTRDNNEFRSENGLLKVSYSPTDKTKITFLSDWFATSREIAPTEAEALLLAPANPLEAKENILRNLSTLRIDTQFLENDALNLSVQPYYQFERSFFEDASPALGSAISLKNQNEKAGLEIRSSYAFKQVELKTQAEIKGEWMGQTSFSLNPAIGSKWRMTPSLSVSAPIKLLQEKLTLIPAFRIEKASDFPVQLAGSFGALYQITDWVQLKGNIGNAFRYPNFNELYFPNQGYIRGNPNLNPEKAFSGDMGFQFNFKKINFEVAYFFSDVGNSILFVPISAFTIAPLNTQGAFIHGIETNAEFKPIPSLNLKANYTFLNASLKESGNAYPSKPKHKLSGKVEWTHPFGLVYTQLQFVDQLPIDFQNTSFLKKRLQLDVGTQIKITPQFQISAEIKNINNESLIDARGFPLPGRSYALSIGVQL